MIAVTFSWGDGVMLEAFRRLFRPADTISRLARGQDRRAFVRAFLEADVHVMEAIQGDGIDPTGLTPEQLLAEIERSAQDLAEDKAREPFVYEHDGMLRLPAFTSLDNVKVFGGAYCRARDRIFPFQVLGVRGSVVAGIAAACDGLVVVLNDGCEDEYAFSAADMDLLRNATKRGLA